MLPLKPSEFDPFYEKFQLYFRGGKDEIISRLQIYKIYLEPLFGIDNNYLVDLGCGRGEWLQLTTTWGFKAKGFDTDEGMLQHCRDLNLTVEHCDAISALKKCQDRSVAVISSFHLIEHLEFDELRELLTQCERVLAEGGVLIFETPNAEHPRVMGETFWLDPTHKRPLPPGFLSFLAKYHGFNSHKIIRINEKQGTNEQASLYDVFNLTSPDCALIAVKGNNVDINKKYEEIFKTNIGSDFDYHIRQFDERLAQRFQFIENRILRIILAAIKKAIQLRLTYLLNIFPKIIINSIIINIYSYIRRHTFMLAFVKKVVSINPNFEKNLIKYLRMNTQSGNRRLTLSPTEKEKHLFFNDYVYKNEIMDHRANIYLSRIKED